MIFVTGANGLLGSQVCKMLVEQGKTVIALVRVDSDTTLLNDILEKITVCYGDILFPEEFELEIKKVSAIIHCAAVVSFYKSDKDKMESVNVTGTTNMVNMALKNNVPYFLHISSVAAIGRPHNKLELTEDDKWQESELNSNYAYSKYHSELEVWRGIEEGLNAAIINPSVILSPDDLDRSSGQLFKYIIEGNKYYPPGSLNYVDIKDVLKAIDQLLSSKTTNKRYILNGGKIKYKVLFDEISKRLNTSPPKIKSTKFLMNIALFTEHIKYLLTGKKPLITRETVQLTNSEIYFSNEKIKQELNFTFASLSETLDWSCEQIKKKL